MSNENSQPAFGARRFGTVNWLGLWTLYVKEVRRFLKVATQTITAPVITTLLFLAVFAVAIAKYRPDVQGVPFVEFLAPGLVMMAMLQNAFANTSSSLLISKVQGNVVDILMPPLSPAELNAGIALAGVTRGAVVGLVTTLCMWPFVHIGFDHLWAVIYFGLSASMMMSLLGMIGGIWSEKFDHLQAVTNFVIMPLTFLSGTFYSVRQLPDFAFTATQYNPIFYMIDGFRYGFTGHADGSIQVGVVVTLALNVTLYAITEWMFRRGYRLKS